MTAYILPGMGADASMYGEEFRRLKDFRFVDWPKYGQEKTITDIAKRIILKNNIIPGDIVGGSSLGGIVAAEISRHIKIKKLILIGSTLTPANINPVLKKFSSFSEITPVNLLQYLVGKVNLVFENRILEMFSKSDTLFIKAMCRAVFKWQGNLHPDCPVAQIHGEKDTVIFPPSTGAEIINNGGHLIAITHEKAVIHFIKTTTIIA